MQHIDSKQYICAYEKISIFLIILYYIVIQDIFFGPEAEMAKLGNKLEDSMQFRLSVDEKLLIKLAAARKQMQDSAYIRESMIKQAEIDLADKTDYGISELEMNAFLTALDKPAAAKPRLKKLLTEKTILE